MCCEWKCTYTYVLGPSCIYMLACNLKEELPFLKRKSIYNSINTGFVISVCDWHEYLYTRVLHDLLVSIIGIASLFVCVCLSYKLKNTRLYSSSGGIIWVILKKFAQRSQKKNWKQLLDIMVVLCQSLFNISTKRSLKVEPSAMHVTIINRYINK